MKKIITVLVVLALSLCLCSCSASNIFEGGKTKRFTMGNVSFSVPESVADKYNRLENNIQEFDIEKVGTITIVQLNKSEDEGYYKQFEKICDDFVAKANSWDGVEKVTSFNGKSVNKGYKQILTYNGATLGTIVVFVDNYCYEFMMEADKKVFSEKNFNDFIGAIRIK